MIKESIITFISDDIIFKEGNALLSGLNKNTELYYMSGGEVSSLEVKKIMDEDQDHFEDQDYFEEEEILNNYLENFIESNEPNEEIKNDSIV